METTLNHGKLNQYLKPYSKRYQLETVNLFRYGKENQPIEMKTSGIIDCTQELEGGNIYTTIELENLTGTTESKAMEAHLQQMLSLSAISKRMIFKRNLKGEVQRIVNQEELEADWQHWAQHELERTFPTVREQQKFVQTYEKGLENLAGSLRNSFQYSLLLPEFLGFWDYKSPMDRTRSYTQHSKLLEDVEYEYQLVTELINDEDTEFHIKLEGAIFNFDVATRQKLELVYAKTRDFTLDDFNLNLTLKYIFKKYDGSIIAAKLNYLESLHEHLNYNVMVTLSEL